MQCTIPMPGQLTVGRSYRPIDRFHSFTGEWYVVQCDDGKVRHFHRSRFGGAPARFNPNAWLGFAGVEKMFGAML